LRKISFSLIYKVTITVVLVSLISACAPPRKAAVTERETITQRAEAERIGGRLIRYVQPGDTLYSIAFAHNLNPNDVAAWNDVSDTRKLHVGKRIRLTQPIGFKPKPTSVKVESIVVGKPPAAAANSTANTTASTTASTTRSNDSTASPTTGTAQSAAIISNKIHWTWPTKGKVIQRFSLSQGQQGVDIQAPQGQAVRATGVGEVVYVGNGLKGYGNLVILKHNELFLSAYAHNQEIFVREGDRVKSQQKIGSVGLNKYGVAALQFQIRRNGKPVNPLAYLKS